VVDRSNPGKIKVSLPSVKNDTGDEPPSKRVKTIGSGLSSGFNSFLPAPKRTGVVANATLGGGAKRGLGSGVNLKTGAAPGFSREPEPERESYNDEEEITSDSKGEGSGLSLPPPKSVGSGQEKQAEVKLVGKPLMFKPLSVARKPQKKKKAIPAAAAATATAPAPSNPATPATPQTTDRPAPRAKVSLFSLDHEESSPAIVTPSGEYKPMMLQPEYEVEEDEGVNNADASEEEYALDFSHIAPPAVPTPPVSQSLDDIAGDLNLSAAERRQLFGRQKGGRGGQSATRVINFNTDQEYQHNEELRAAGEQVSHNPVRAIAPGKHSLKQLVTAAQNQKEALEESFAKGKSNRAEASSRYGW